MRYTRRRLPARITFFDRDEAPSRWQPGDFILTHGLGPVSQLVRSGQRLRFRGGDGGYAYWNHAALVTSPTGDLIEVNKPGVIRTHADAYRDVPYAVVHVDGDAAQRLQAVGFAEAALEQPHRVITARCFFILCLTSLVGRRVPLLPDAGAMTCSEFVARCQLRLGAVFDRALNLLSPADLARHYDVVGARSHPSVIPQLRPAPLGTEMALSA